MTNPDDLISNLEMLLTSLVRGKTGSEENEGSKDPYVNTSNWSKKMFEIIVSEGIPTKLHLDEELFLSIVLNLFVLTLQTIKKGFIYILIGYDYKRKCLKVQIDEKGMIVRTSKPSKKSSIIPPNVLNRIESLELSYQIIFSKVDYQSLEFKQGGDTPKHWSLIEEIIKKTAIKNRGYFKIKKNPEMGNKYIFAMQALPASEAISDHEELE